MKLMKRSVSVILAFLMIFGSMTVLASAALGDGQQNTASFDTKFYRNVMVNGLRQQKLQEAKLLRYA